MKTDSVSSKYAAGLCIKVWQIWELADKNRTELRPDVFQRFQRNRMESKECRKVNMNEGNIWLSGSCLMHVDVS